METTKNSVFETTTKNKQQTTMERMKYDRKGT